ncbi:hypothetical protein [Micromonospora sp. NBC_01813]|uniref:hypothetical protein n=1 Tax=Micromonospora sp. NBC_01813 TaxID=2975988 RepID=UPI002DD858C8|nr:hypothetical protein [Micromonospora sp. NBC_01813]WSA07512.1 hypothetical protein OG958_25170 [Micromonospora sp. NBC_01813]
MGRSAHRRAPTPTRSGSRARRAVIAVATLGAFGVLIGVSQISNAQTDRREPIQINGLEVLGNTCEGTNLEPHSGFQEGNRCVSTAFGEVGDADKNPTLLITEAPETVGVGEPFQLRVSTRNLVRDRFLPAGQGGYYLESALLTGEGLTRGHFHTACRMLTSTTEALDPAPVPAFFVATEDGGGGAEPDVVTIQIPGLPQEGIAQCASWAGDGSHRIPMMQRANQTPALDAVRIRVQVPGAEEPPAEEPPAEEPPAEEPPAEEPPAEEPPAEEPPAEEPPAEEPPAEEPPAEEPPAEEPPAEEPPAEEPPAQEEQEQPAPASPEASASPEVEATESAAPVRGVTGRTPDPTESATPVEEEEPEPSPTTGAGGLNAPATDNLAVDDATDDAESPEELAERLALTGTNTINVMVGGLVLVFAGVGLVYLTQRRRHQYRRR